MVTTKNNKHGCKVMSVKLTNPTIDVINVLKGDKTEESIVIRGIIDPESYTEIKVAAYQREVVPGTKAKGLLIALRNSTVPDVDLGMRGEKYTVKENKETGENIYHLHGDVFVIDGLQRISSAKNLISADPKVKPRIGAMVHINTTEEWEAERFRILNQERLKLNSNILLRNARMTSPAMDMIYKLVDQDAGFVLHHKVQWSQRKARNELLTAMILCQTAGYLHSRFGPGRMRDSGVVKALDTTMEVVGRTTMRDNIKTYFEVLDECFGVKRVVYSHSAPFLRHTFLVALADLFTRHTDFWKGQRLFVEKNLRGKIAKFEINDPSISNLASSGGKAKDILYHVLLEHVNSGKRTRRLTPVDGMEPKSLPMPEPEQVIEGK